MKRLFFTCLVSSALLCTMQLSAQKKVLDHTVYDSWQSIGETNISNNGAWIVYAVNVQEGDNELVIQSADGSYKKTIARGYNANITEDNRFLVFRIKPYYAQLREAKIKKKKPEETPKDTLAIIELGKDSIWKKEKIKGFKLPEKSAAWLAYHLEKESKPAAAPKGKPVNKTADSLMHVIDSLQQVIAEQAATKGKKKSKKDDETIEALYSLLDAEGDEPGDRSAEAGSTLVLRNLANGKQQEFKNVLEYYFDKNGTRLLLEQSKAPGDSLSKPAIVWFDLQQQKADTILLGGNEFKNFEFAEDGSQVAFIAERDAAPKALTKTFKLWHYTAGQDSARVLVDNKTAGLPAGSTVSPFANISFSKSGKKLYFDTAPIPAPKDTTLVDIDLVKLDIWHYNEDYLQTTQLSRVNRAREEDFQAVYDLTTNSFTQLTSKEIPNAFLTKEGDGENVLAVTDFGRRVESQWAGNTKKDVYWVNVNTGAKTLVLKNMNGQLSPAYISPSGKYFIWYNYDTKSYHLSEGNTSRNISQGYTHPLWDEENDTPSDPSPYGFMGWDEKEAFVYVYDKYGIVKLFTAAGKKPEVFLTGRPQKVIYRYIRTDREERFIQPAQELLIRSFNDINKDAGLLVYKATNDKYVLSPVIAPAALSLGMPFKAKNNQVYAITEETYQQSPNVYAVAQTAGNTYTAKQLSNTNPQQSGYNWGTAELYKWKTFSGKTSTGILYKPEDFDSTKKYPLILYFYETLSNGLHSYVAPAPTPSRLNISFFVSRGYLVFAPDIYYTKGYPAKSAYDYIVSAAKDLSKHKWVDGKNLGIQGQSWGGIQVAQLVTMTDMFKAAWSGAPVANMTSAYGGIRWESGMNRQFQYEKTQSRIGATLWEKPQLYIENSPLFHLPKVKTPIVIMANDADGAVPWYQGIELFTGLRRLGKQAWMLNYNGEAHNLVERKNRKDIQIREQQFFDWLLKGAKPARWITEGVPAVEKGRSWGLELVD